jgi:hypothetical protein
VRGRAALGESRAWDGGDKALRAVMAGAGAPSPGQAKASKRNAWQGLRRRVRLGVLAAPVEGLAGRARRSRLGSACAPETHPRQHEREGRPGTRDYGSDPLSWLRGPGKVPGSRDLAGWGERSLR